MPSRSIAVFDAVVSTLTGLATTGANVKKSRAYNLPDKVESGLSIRAGGEVTRDWNSGRVEKTREIKVTIHVAAKESLVDDIVLQIEAEIWAAMQADPTLGLAFVQDNEFNQSAEIEHEPGALITARLEHTWLVHYTHSPTSMES